MTTTKTIYRIKYLDEKDGWQTHSQYHTDKFSEEKLRKRVTDWNEQFEDMEYRLIKITRTEIIEVIK